MTCIIPDCTATLSVGCPIPLCLRHAEDAADWIESLRRAPPVVYFARPHDRRDVVKIGWTRDLPARMDQLRLAVVAIEDGDQRREAELHREFAHLRCPAPDGGPSDEWFTFAGFLAVHVDALLADGRMSDKIGGVSMQAMLARSERQMVARRNVEQPPRCDRCSRSLQKILVPAFPGDPSWVWGCDCPP